MDYAWVAGLWVQGEKFYVEIRKSTWSKSGRRAWGPREEKLKLKFGKQLGVRVGRGVGAQGKKF